MSCMSISVESPRSGRFAQDSAVLAPSRCIRRAYSERITIVGVKHMGDLELILVASIASLVCLIASLWINNGGSMA
jgi:hypothetical protein